MRSSWRNVWVSCELIPFHLVGQLLHVLSSALREQNAQFCLSWLFILECWILGFGETSEVLSLETSPLRRSRPSRRHVVRFFVFYDLHKPNMLRLQTFLVRHAMLLGIWLYCVIVLWWIYFGRRQLRPDTPEQKTEESNSFCLSMRQRYTILAGQYDQRAVLLTPFLPEVFSISCSREKEAWNIEFAITIMPQPLLMSFIWSKLEK